MSRENETKLERSARHLFWGLIAVTPFSLVTLVKSIMIVDLITIFGGIAVVALAARMFYAAVTEK